MYIQTSYNASVYAELSTSSTTQKSLVDYLNDSDDEESSVTFDTVTLSSEAYAAIAENNPEILEILGYEESEETTSYGTSSTLDNVELSEEAYAALLESNPEVLEALGYDIAEETETESESDESADTE